MKKFLILTSLTLVVPATATTIYVSEDFVSTIIWDHKIKRLKMEKPHYEVRAKGKKLQVQAKSKESTPITLTLFSAKREKIELHLVCDAERAQDIYDLRKKKEEVTKAIDMDYFRLLDMPHNASIAGPIGMITAIMRSHGKIYVKIILEGGRILSDVEASTEGKNSTSIETDYRIVRWKGGHFLLVKLTPSEKKAAIKITIMDQRGKKLTHFTLKPSKYV